MNARVRFLVCLVALVATSAPSLFAQPAVAPAPPAANGRDTVTPAARDANWMQRHELINSRAVPDAVELIFIGDSITQGWESAGKQVWEKFYGGRKAINAGIGGDRTQHVLWRLDHGNVKGITPKVAVVMIGTNNAKTNEPADTAAGIEAVVRSLRQKLPGTKVLLLGVFPRGATVDDPWRKKNEVVNEIIAKLDNGKDVCYLDIGPKFLAADGAIAKGVMPDHLHLSPRGYEIWAEAIEPKMQELLGGG